MPQNLGDLMYLPENKGTHKITLHLNRMPKHIHAMYLVASAWATATMKDIKHPSVKCVQNTNASNSSRATTRGLVGLGTVTEERAASLPVELCRFGYGERNEQRHQKRNYV